jgi:hypothetical protein
LVESQAAGLASAETTALDESEALNGCLFMTRSARSFSIAKQSKRTAA